MEHKVNLIDLSIDQIMRKIKAFKNDGNLTGLTLVVKRRQQDKGLSKSRIKQGQPSNIQNLIQQRKNKDKNNIVSESDSKNQNSAQDELWAKKNQTEDKKKQQLTQNQSQIETYEFISDEKLNKARKNYAQGNFDMAISILTSIFNELQQEEEKGGSQVSGDRHRKLANVTFQLANCYYRKKNYEKAIQFYNYQIPEQNFKHKAMRKSNLGAIYLHLNKNQQSLRNYTHALKIYSQCQCENVDLSNTYHNVGNIYLRQKMYDAASKYFQMSIQERKHKSPDAELSLFYSAFKLGISLKFQQKYEQSIKSLFYALSYSERGVGDPVQVFKQIAMVYQLTKKSNDALNYYEKICDNAKATEQDKGYAYQRAALIYIRQNQQSQGQRIMKIACQCYESAGNERKTSNLRKNFKLNSSIR